MIGRRPPRPSRRKTVVIVNNRRAPGLRAQLDPFVGPVGLGGLSVLGLRVYPSSPHWRDTRRYRPYAVQFYVGASWDQALMMHVNRDVIAGWAVAEHCARCNRPFATRAGTAMARAAHDDLWADTTGADRCSCLQISMFKIFTRRRTVYDGAEDGPALRAFIEEFMPTDWDPLRLEIAATALYDVVTGVLAVADTYEEKHVLA